LARVSDAAGFLDRKSPATGEPEYHLKYETKTSGRRVGGVEDQRGARFEVETESAESKTSATRGHYRTVDSEKLPGGLLAFFALAVAPSSSKLN